MSQTTYTNQDLVGAIDYPIISALAEVVLPAPGFIGLSEHSLAGIQDVTRGQTMQDANPVLVFNSIAGATYSVFDNDVLVGTITAVGNESPWFFSTLSEGLHNITVTYTTDAGTSAPLAFSFTIDTSPVVPTIASVIDVAGPLAGAVAMGGIATDTHPVIEGSGHRGNIVEVYDNTTLLGSAAVDGEGKWSFQPVAALSDGAHNVHVTATSLIGTSEASPSYAFSTTQIMVTGVTSNGVDVANGGTVNGTVTVTGWIADPSLASKGIGIYLSGGNQGTTRAWDNSVVGNMTINGNIFTAAIAKDSILPGNFPLADGTYHIDVKALGASSDIRTTSNADLGWTFTENSSAHAVQSVAATHSDASTAATQAASADVQATASSAVSDHAVLQTSSANHTVDLNADPASYFKDASAHVQGGTSGVSTLHLTGDHQVLDLTSLSGKTAAAKVSGIEAVDLGGAHNMLKLSLVDVLNLAEPDLFQKDGKQQMLVSGSNGDSVDLSNAHIAGVADGHWMQGGTAVVSGVTYNVYEHSGAHVELLVQQGVQIALHG
ncbi:Ig-like domain-containing protein [Caballeronia sp. SBC2]|uniref:Ig-like domain-containing protein n=1 Tax=Caballeronia sp. SBC2 TaxID=2705547 RepID=UPI0013E1D919|nr:Ig-like domain-containing protein [Caballeronia sp. SBC2]QIE22460.1 hypothetical protein SBC2_04700 [Caballeronia sp. SBC2]